MKFTTNHLSAIAGELAARYQFFLIDLDNTLYDENKYLFPVYKKIAERFAPDYAVSSSELENYLRDTFLAEGRHLLFNRFCSRFNIPESRIGEMLDMMRNIQFAERIPLYPNAGVLMNILIRERKKIFVVTNGNLQQQKNKVNSLDWNGADKSLTFIYTALYQPKPSRAAFDYIVKEFQAEDKKTLMIGDTETDRDFAKNAGIDFLLTDVILSAE